MIDVGPIRAQLDYQADMLEIAFEKLRSSNRGGRDQEALITILSLMEHQNQVMRDALSYAESK